MYGEDLACVHDEGFSGFAARAAPGLLEVFRRHGVGAGTGLVVDLGCGSGRWATRLLAEGFSVMGYDVSKAMIRMARRRAPGARFHERSFLEDFELPRCDAVTALGECINYRQPSEVRPWASRRRLLQRVHAALRPGGLFVFDVAEPGREPPGVRLRHFEGPDWTVLVHYHADGARRRLTRRITTFRRPAGEVRFRRSEELHHLSLFDVAHVLRELRGVGFDARSLGGYGFFRLPRGLRVVIARKPV